MAKAINNFYHKNPSKAYELYSVTGCKFVKFEMTIADARELFEEVCDKDDWKAPVPKTEVDSDRLFEYEAAISFFHGESPTMSFGYEVEGKELIWSDGYVG